MRIALCQMDIVWQNKKKNYEKASHFIKEAAQNKVDLILFPEMSFTGFCMCIEATREQDKASVSYIQKEAIVNQIAIGFGWVKAQGDKAENHYTLINKRGEVVSDYIKIHPFSHAGEDKYFVSGEKLTYCEIEGNKISTFICYDLRFPEIFQVASSNVAIIIVAANWPAARSEHWKVLLRARAIENQAFVVGVNCVGEKKGQYYSGDSCLITPLGDVLASLAGEEGLIIDEINDCTQEVRQAFQHKKDRKNTFYKNIL